eukprot:COSAG04_NODE_5513_length_1589_cov_1.454362_2_plen_90_part_00
MTSTGKIAELIERGKVRTLHFFELLDAQLASNEFVAGDFFSAADITALCAMCRSSAKERPSLPRPRGEGVGQKRAAAGGGAASTCCWQG